jgi:cell shape-determining protein MreC
MALLILLGVLSAVSFSHLAWDGRPLPALLQRNFYVLLGGRLADPLSSQQPDPLAEALGQENKRLHELLALRSRLPGVTQAATVVRREPETWWNVLEVEFALAVSGPPPQATAIVLTPQGLIGTLETRSLIVVTENGQSFCRGTVNLLSSPETQLSVVVGEQQAPFLLEGRGGADFALRPVTSVAEKSVVSGDPVQTSGLGQLYSKGLLVGVVSKDSRWAKFSTCAATPSEVLLWWR